MKQPSVPPLVEIVDGLDEVHLPDYDVRVVRLVDLDLQPYRCVSDAHLLCLVLGGIWSRGESLWP